MRSVRYQMTAARFPVHRDLAGFDFERSPVDRKLVLQLGDMAFTEQAHNVVHVGASAGRAPARATWQRRLKVRSARWLEVGSAPTRAWRELLERFDSAGVTVLYRMLTPAANAGLAIAAAHGQSQERTTE